MKKYFYITKNTKQITMVADGKLEFDKEKFDEVYKTITETEWQQIDNAEKSFIKDDKFEIIDRIDVKQTQKEKLNQIKNKIDNNQLTQKDALKQLIDLI